jgi:hypothetical protein
MNLAGAVCRPAEIIIDLPLILKVWDFFFFVGKTYICSIMGHFEGFFKGALTFLNPL